MKNFICRLFFDSSGECLQRYSMSGDVTIQTVEEDINVYLPNELLENIIVKEIPQEDIETLNNLNSCYNVKLNLETNELEFDFNFPEPENTGV